jgi:Ca2+-binding EF-hand superfamily protein
MGQAPSSTLKNNELIEFSKASNFSRDTVCMIHTIYSHYSKLHKDDGIIDYKEFCTIFLSDPNKVLQSIFNIFDANGDSSINFREFLVGISGIFNDPKEKQISLLFRLLDENESGKISKQCLITTLSEWVQIFPEIGLPKEIVEKIVEDTFTIVGKDYMEESDFIKFLSKTKLLNLKFEEDIITYKIKLLKGNKRSKSMCGPISQVD